MTSRQSDTSRHLEVVPAGSVDALADARDRHPSAAMGRHLDTYLAAVAEALQIRGVIPGPPQRTDSTSHLIGSLVIDCTAVRSTEAETALLNLTLLTLTLLNLNLLTLTLDRPWATCSTTGTRRR